MFKRMQQYFISLNIIDYLSQFDRKISRGSVSKCLALVINLANEKDMRSFNLRFIQPPSISFKGMVVLIHESL